MRAGRLDRRITISRKVETLSDSGAPSVSWTEVATVWTQVKFDRGSERFATQQVVGQGVVTFLVRWSDAVKEVSTVHRVTFDGRDYDIRDVRELGRREGIEIDATVRTEEALAS